MNAEEYIKEKAKSEWGLRLILEGISNAQKPVLYRLLEEYAEQQVKNCYIPDVSARTVMRKQAITVFELTKGFTGEPTDNAIKTALEMADYVMRLTNDLD